MTCTSQNQSKDEISILTVLKCNSLSEQVIWKGRKKLYTPYSLKKSDAWLGKR